MQKKVFLPIAAVVFLLMMVVSIHLIRNDVNERDRIIYVSVNGSDKKDGRSWEHAKSTIQGIYVEGDGAVLLKDCVFERVFTSLPIPMPRGPLR